MAGPFDLTGQNIENTYQRVLQTDGTNVYDGTGSLFTLPAAGVSQITAGNGIVLSPAGGTGVVEITALAASYNTATGSYGSFYDTGSQTAVLNTAIYSMSLSTTDISNGVYIDPTDRTRIYFTNAGVYNVQFSAQFSNTGNNPDDVTIWIRKNDIGSINDIPDSSGVCTIPAKKGSVPGQLITSWNYYITAADNDFVQLCWAANTSNIISLETIAAGTNPVYPRTPSLILTAQRIDTFLSNTGSFSGSFTGEFIGTASWATNANNAAAVDIFSLSAPVDSYLLMSNVIATSGVGIGGNNNIRYNSSTNVFSVGNISATTITSSLFGTASWANSASNAVSSSYALSSSYSLSSLNTLTASLALSASGSLTGSLLGTASWATNTITSSRPIAVTGSTIYSTAPATSNINTNNNIFLGGSSGLAATNASNAIFLGNGTGYQATNAAQSIFLGISAGRTALNAAQSNFIGVAAGMQASSASFSTFMGYYAGYNASSTGVGSNNIIIGTNITLPDRTKDSINLGGIIFATGSYSTITGDPYSGSQYGIGKVGINKVIPEYTLDVSGSSRITGDLIVTGIIDGGTF